MNNKIILILSLLTAILLILVSCFGWLDPNTYKDLTLNWHTQSVAQDIVDLFLITPFLILTSVFAYRKSRTGLMLWSGGIFYLIYTFVIFAFAVKFNNMFIVYCILLGLTFYMFMYYLFSAVKMISGWSKDNIPVKSIGIYLIFISCAFYLLWLSDIIPAMIDNTALKSLQETGLLTNPVHAIDLSVCLPGLFITAILLMKKHPLGILLTPAMLVFTILMYITLSVMVIFMKSNGLEAELTLVCVFCVLALISSVLLVRYLRSLNVMKS
jgi:hypothetical protein